MSNEDRRNRSDRLKRRFERDDAETADTGTSGERAVNESKTSKTGQTANTEKREETTQTEETERSEDSKSESVKNRPSVLMYLPKDVHEELDIRFDELNAKHKRAHGEKLEKNRHYYPAVVKAGLEGSDVEEILDI